MGRIIQGAIGIPFPCQPLKTEQTTQYSSKEDDGYWQKGISKKYVVLSAGQYSGTVNIVLNAKTYALSNNCVFDKKTGLMWARYVPDGDIGPDGDGKLLWVDDVNNEDIFDFKDQANAKELGGHADWRVPNVKELSSLLTFGRSNPAIDTTAFPSTPNSYQWSSTTNDNTTAQAQAAQFGYGDVRGQTKDTQKYHCRLVRGPK
jgi:hypothetical protein